MGKVFNFDEYVNEVIEALEEVSITVEGKTYSFCPELSVGTINKLVDAAKTLDSGEGQLKALVEFIQMLVPGLKANVIEKMTARKLVELSNYVLKNIYNLGEVTIEG